ncbi:MAG: pyruvate kinase [Oscillospiraceae bacterium]|nr:pyruvate kinase [Oscillospiraceae bacterium]
MLKKTKIVCTLGPSTKEDATLREMIKAGMNVARFNFSHGTHESHKVTLDQLRRIREEMGVHIAALLDTKGPDVRLQQFKENPAFDGRQEYQLEEGQSFTLHATECEGNENGCTINYKHLARDVKVGTRILLDDGLIEMKVIKIHGTDVVCKVMNTAIIKSNKGVNVPEVRLSMPYMSKKDRDDIEFAIKNEYDYIAASFVGTAQDVLDIRRILDINKCNTIRIIAKIENAEGVENIKEILEVSDGIMVARGDMGVEIDMAELPSIQKKLIRMCYTSGKPVITATQMLESMIHHPRPTRAEVSDVANAVYDGTSAVMLSGETAAGLHPVEAVQTMAAIIARTESNINYSSQSRRGDNVYISVTDALCHAACSTCAEVGADAILTVSITGKTARLLSKYRPDHPIYACVTDEHIARHLSLSWGIYPLVIPVMKTAEELMDKSERLVRDVGYLKSGDVVVVVAGVPITGPTNMITIHLVGESLISGVGICGDKVKGDVCVCHSEADAIENFREGQILVISSTTNALLPIIKQAEAVITEEAGASSHAAIVGLTLDKPVIVGAKNATKLLKTGMTVSVDATRGNVLLLED